MPSITVSSPIGPLTLTEREGCLTELLFGPSPLPVHEEETALLARAARELDAYFFHGRKTFDLPLAPVGTAFQTRVWTALMDIPYGKTETYGHLAARMQAPKACRAVGGANHCNPLPILIPCHRVVGAGGKLTGYGGGLEIKKFLLDLEAANT